MIVAYIVCGEIEYEKTVWQGDGKMFWRVGEKKRDNRLETGEQKDCNVMKTGVREGENTGRQQAWGVL